MTLLPYRDAIISRLRACGVLVGGCGERTIRIRPTLVFRPDLAEIMLDRLDGVLRGMGAAAPE